MLARRRVAGFLLVLSGVLGAALAGCGNPNGLDSILVTPASESLNTGQTAQLSAIGTFGNAKHSHQQNVTTGVTWTSNKPSVATVDSAGLVTAVAPGTTTITATAASFNGETSSTSLVTVTGAGGGGGTPGGGSLLSLQIIPNSITVGNLQDTGQFLAIGTFSNAPFVRDLTNAPYLTWISATPSVFPVTTNTGGSLGATAGVVTAYGIGTAQITAEAKNPADGTLQTATATFTCPAPDNPPKPGQCYQGSQAPSLLATLTVYNEGLNTTTWDVTAPSATGTPNVIHCGPGDASGTSVCTATYPFNFQLPNGNAGLPANTVILKASGGSFGGWSYNCAPSDVNGNLIPATQINQNGPNYCRITFDFSGPNTNVTIGAIFN